MTTSWVPEIDAPTVPSSCWPTRAAKGGAGVEQRAGAE